MRSSDRRHAGEGGSVVGASVGAGNPEGLGLSVGAEDGDTDGAKVKVAFGAVGCKVGDPDVGGDNAVGATVVGDRDVGENVGNPVVGGDVGNPVVGGDVGWAVGEPVGAGLVPQIGFSGVPTLQYCHLLLAREV